jgi:hypothetical protein
MLLLIVQVLTVMEIWMQQTSTTMMTQVTMMNRKTKHHAIFIFVLLCKTYKIKQ